MGFSDNIVTDLGNWQLDHALHYVSEKELWQRVPVLSSSGEKTFLVSCSRCCRECEMVLMILPGFSGHWKIIGWNR